jgi:putative oxygen-independent coproporphyrinogen III oxidase
MSDLSNPAFGVYVHWPFCASKCPYCDFNSHVRHQSVDETRFANALSQEIAWHAGLAPGRTVNSIFFGGGTPSLMQPKTVETVLNAIAHHWTLADDAEITLEANPTSVEAERFKGYRAAGVNRVSLGVQSLNDAELHRLGRRHTATEALAAVKLAQSVFDRYSFDLIYARPGQTSQMWEQELREALVFAGDHLSMYQLTIEEGTPYEALFRAGKLVMPSEDVARALWDVTQEMCTQAGLPAYEISNHARLGHESRHNMIYWRSHEWAGIGPGAHGRLNLESGRTALSTERHPENWATLVETQGHGLIMREEVNATERGDEYLLMGLRLREGINFERFFTLSGRHLDQRRVEDLINDRLIERLGNNRLRVTTAGMPVLDAVVADLAA